MKSKLELFLGDDYGEVLEDENPVNDNEPRIWYSGSKKQTVNIRDMETFYIKNCIAMINGTGKTPPTSLMLAKKDTYLRWFNEELKRRELL